MKTLPRFRREALLLLVLALLTLPLSLAPSRSSEPSPTLDDVVDLGRELGLHPRLEPGDSALPQKLVLATEPLTFDQANNLRMGDQEHPNWTGKVCVIQHQDDVFFIAYPRAWAVWGDMLFFGDRQLIEQLLARRRW